VPQHEPASSPSKARVPQRSADGKS
jgi:hypothetical protein